MLQSDDWLLRETAVATLSALGRCGDPRIMAAAARTDEDDNWFVREAGSKLMARLVI